MGAILTGWSQMGVGPDGGAGGGVKWEWGPDGGGGTRQEWWPDGEAKEELGPDWWGGEQMGVGVPGDGVPIWYPISLSPI